MIHSGKVLSKQVLAGLLSHPRQKEPNMIRIICASAVTIVLLLFAHATEAATQVAPPIDGIPVVNSPVRLETQLAQERRYIRGPRGGCYYINRNGNRTYVDRRLCR
jgi:hypothetical protein